MEILSLLGTSLGLGAGAGVNAYATLLVFGTIARWNPELFPGTTAAFFAQTPVLIVLGLLYTVEFIADKVPAIDHVWDAIHTFIRPAAGAVVGLASASPELPKSWLVMASVIAGGAALTGHLTKSSIRGLSTATTGGVANPVLSVVEDVYAVLQAVGAAFLPIVCLVVVAFVLMIALLLLLRRRPRPAGLA